MVIRVVGTEGNDVFFGNPVSEWFYSLAGYDIALGNVGKDVFTIAADGAPKIFGDFENGSDLVDLSLWGVTSFDQLVITTVSPEKSLIKTMDGGLEVIITTTSDEPLDIDATDFLYAGTPIYEYSTGFDSVDVTNNEYAVHLGNGGSNWMNLKSLVSGSETASQGAMVVMDDDMLGNGTFTVKGVTQHFFDFQNIRGTNGKDTFYGDQQDNHFAGLNNADVIHGGGGNDRLFGNAGTDKLYGDDGDDVINGGDGYDHLWGGEGSDVFVFVSYDDRKDVVYDYEDGTDSLDISQWGADSIDDLEIVNISRTQVRVTLSGSDLGFVLKADGDLLAAADIDNSDFIFA